jgi:type VI secretion system protein ImpL
MTPMLAKFPFNPDATTEATVAEVSGLLAPGTGSLFAFQQERLGDLLEKEGDKWVAKPANGVQLSQPFVAFFNRAAQVSAALYGGGNQPRVILHAHGEASPQVPTVNLYYGSQVAPFRTNTPPAQLVWPNPTGRDVRLTAQLGKQKEKTIAQAKGEWALFRLVAQAARVQGSGGTLRAEWNPPDRGQPPVAVEFTFANGAPVLQRGWLGGMSCAAQVTR